LRPPFVRSLCFAAFALRPDRTAKWSPKPSPSSPAWPAPPTPTPSCAPPSCCSKPDANAVQTTQLVGTNPVLTPNNNGAAEPVIGQVYSVTWDGTGLSSVVDLALCQGPSTACNIVENIALGIPNNNAYSWTVDCSLAATASNAGYGILLIDDSTGQYQYSTQFGLQADTSGACSGTSPSGSSSAPSGSPTGGSGGHSRTGASGSASTASASSGSGSGSSAPTGTGSGSAPTGPAGGYGLNSTSTSYVVPTGPAGGSPSPTYSSTPGSSGAASSSSVARSLGGLAVAVLAAAVALA
jgi:hypothetical protein